MSHGGLLYSAFIPNCFDEVWGEDYRAKGSAD